MLWARDNSGSVKFLASFGGEPRADVSPNTPHSLLTTHDYPQYLRHLQVQQKTRECEGLQGDLQQVMVKMQEALLAREELADELAKLKREGMSLTLLHA